MTTLERIKNLCKQFNISVTILEEKLDFPKNTLYQWNKRTPSVDKLEKVADYFNVSIDYLLGRTDKRNYFDLTAKDERDIQKELNKIIEGLSDTNGSYAAFDGQTLDDLDEEDRELLIASLENSLRLAKRIAKQKFTPKKYRDK
ncbi:XRE family transcriptional regulator [Rummeliibacillus sp. TYF005]|uniref:helix-turn-helix domain-containing protein n=1 Tax=Rummeliibacillus sp. TYF005 TaxID=2058214 RepID=UPI000F5261A6|nr:helix-turn-helix transcriptional regulator [Rummeliibacillus sp. TYF005]RPJ97253.1 XRE family transcriptional regulator [Rummeliibacillus sp. TYF005]